MTTLPNLFVAGFIGSPSMNFFDGSLVMEGDTMFVDLNSFRVKVPKERQDVYKDLGRPGCDLWHPA